MLLMGGTVLLGGTLLVTARPALHEPDVYLAGPTFKVSGLQFTVPSRWQKEPAANDARAGQWHVPPPRGEEGEGGEVIVFYFGPGVGGSVQDNVTAWRSTMTGADGNPVKAEVKDHVDGTIKITQASLFGTYSDPVPIPGLPPQLKPHYGLLGAIIEGPNGTVYWRFTGPETLITASLPLFSKIINTVKPESK